MDDSKPELFTEDTCKKCAAFPCKVTFRPEEYVVTSPPVELDACKDYASSAIGDVSLLSQGRLLELSLKLKNICPQKEVAVGIVLHELDNMGCEHARGFKAIRYPGHNNTCCCDVLMKGILFVLPDDCKCPVEKSICDPKRFRVRVIAHYITTDLLCMDQS